MLVLMQQSYNKTNRTPTHACILALDSRREREGTCYVMNKCVKEEQGMMRCNEQRSDSVSPLNLYLIFSSLS